MRLFWLLVFAATLIPAFAQTRGAELIYSSYLGGREPDMARSVATDGAGNIYITGTTFSRDFPVAAASQSQCLLGPLNGCKDIFVAKFDPSGSRLIYATYFGSRSNDEGNDIAVDADGNAVVVGSAGSDLIAVKLDPAGRLQWVIGYTAPPLTSGRAVALDAAGNVYITGETLGRTFYTVNALQAAAGANSCTAIGGGSFPVEAFVIKLAPNGRTVFSTYLGGDGNDLGRDIAVDAEQNVYVTGSTSSRNFPLVRAPQSAYGGGEPQGAGQCTGGDAFLTKISPDGRSIVFSTYLGGSDDETANALAVDVAGNIFVGGSTSTAPGGFLTKFNADGRVLFSLQTTRIAGLAVDRAGNAYIAGESVASVDPLARSVQLLPPSGGVANAVALSPAGHLLAVGEVESGRLVTVRPFQPAGRGFRDAMLVMYALQSREAVIVNAANYAGPNVAPGSLASLFGPDLGSATYVTLRDTGGAEHAANLSFVSSGQINFLVPPGLAGETEVLVIRNGAAIAVARGLIEPVAPALFTADASGRGLPASAAVRIAPDGSQTASIVAEPIDRPASGERVILLLFGTGIRGHHGLDSVTATIGGRRAAVLAAEPQSQFPGLDQVNVEIPADLPPGAATIVLKVDGRLANPVEIRLR